MGCQPCEGHTYGANLNFNMIDMVLKDGRLLLLKNDEKVLALLGIFSGEPQTQTEPVQVGDLTIAQTLEYGVVWYTETIEELLKGKACRSHP